MESVHPLGTLLVDHDRTFRRGLSELLGPVKDLRITECDSTKNATAILQQDEFDVIMLDQDTVASSEIDFYGWMRETGIETPVILLVSEETERTTTEVLKPEVYDYMRKDLIVRHHFPIILNGIRERYLFRKFREQRARDNRDAERRRRMTESLCRTAEAISLSVSNSLSILLAESEEYIETFRKRTVTSALRKEFLPKEGGSMTEASMAFSRLHHDVETVAAGIRSLTTLSNVLLSRIDDPNDSLHSGINVEPHYPGVPEQENDERMFVRDFSPPGS